MDSLEKSEAVKKPKLKSSDEKEVPVKSYLEQLLTFVDFKESVCLVMNKISEMKKEVQADFEIGYSFHECKLLLLQQDSLELQCASVFDIETRSCWFIAREKFLNETIQAVLQDLGRWLAFIGCSTRPKKRSHNCVGAVSPFPFEFRKEIQEIKDFTIRFDSCNDLQNEMEASIQKIQVFIDHLCLQLIDVLIKLRLSDQLKEKHRYHVGGWLTFMEVERVQAGRTQQTLYQTTFHVATSKAIQWLKDLTSSMLFKGEEIGESAEEADDLFLQHIQFQQAGKKSYEIGVQLTEIAENLRTKAGIPKEWPLNDTSLHVELEESSTEFWRLLRKLEDLVKSIRSRLKVFGEIRRNFVIQRYKKTWIKIFLTIQKCQENGRILLETLKEPLTNKHRVNLLSNSAAIQLDRTMSQTPQNCTTSANNYFNEEAPSATESASEYVSARSQKLGEVPAYLARRRLVLYRIWNNPGRFQIFDV
ncbi:uncharacterized protein CEXT_64861 [Caerostris extrusa]|uniref:Uncharacterized protein n=1 Tax=Caerostris extrusa TaxID=172846 RepID=A0AAV4T0G2_CAEEX|nr:uncharacterized protein CEXT_64861 [Caerostris extrusa]